MSDEAVRRRVMTRVGHTDTGARHLIPLEPADALHLLTGAVFGRVVFTLNALPAIRPVNHLVDDGQIIIRTRLTAKLASGAVGPPRGIVVAYEADDLDPINRLGWSVVVTGIARPITDPAHIARYEQLLHPWVDSIMDTAIAIQPEIISGFRLGPSP